MRTLPFASAACLFLASCHVSDENGMVLMVDQRYRPEIVLRNADGISSPDGLLWSSGTLFIADEGGSAIRSWQPGGRVNTLADQRSGLASPEDLVRTATGALFATDDSAGGIWHIEPGGGTVNIALQDPKLASTEGIVLAGDESLLVGDPERDQILRVAEGVATARLPVARAIGKPESFALDDRGRLFVADNESDILYSIGPDGAAERRVSDRAGFSPESIHYSRGVLFITDSKHGKLFRYSDQDGLTVMATFTGKLSNLQGVTADDGGNLYLSVQSDLGNRQGLIIRLVRTAP